MAINGSDYVPINQGGTPGVATSGTYGVARIDDLKEGLGLGTAAEVDVNSGSDFTTDTSSVPTRGSVKTLVDASIPTTSADSNFLIDSGSLATRNTIKTFVESSVLLQEQYLHSSWTIDPTVNDSSSNADFKIIAESVTLSPGKWVLDSFASVIFTGSSVSNQGSTRGIAFMRTVPQGADPSVLSNAIATGTTSSDMSGVSYPANQNDIIVPQLENTFTLTAETTVDVYLGSYVLSGIAGDNFQYTNRRVKFTKFTEV